jgi:SAM-dependent methyltransferase
MKDNSFDTIDTKSFNEARRRTLDLLWPDLHKRAPISSALDVGCGVGIFSEHLASYGCQVTAIDGREENIAEAQRRTTANVSFSVCDVEDTSVSRAGQFDCVLCLGLLYHLENPLRALRNIASLARHFLVVESVTAPGNDLKGVLYEEDERRNQGLTYTALILTERCLVKVLYKTGFAHVYRVRTMPNHSQFHATLTHRQRRTVLVASREAISSPLLSRVAEPHTKPYLWDRSYIGLIGSRLVRRLLGRIPDNKEYSARHAGANR